jgi:hypothetical protein
MQVKKALVFVGFRTHSFFHRPVDSCARIDCNTVGRDTPGEDDAFMHNC